MPLQDLISTILERPGREARSFEDVLSAIIQPSPERAEKELAPTPEQALTESIQTQREIGTAGEQAQVEAFGRFKEKLAEEKAAIEKGPVRVPVPEVPKVSELYNQESIKPMMVIGAMLMALSPALGRARATRAMTALGGAMNGYMDGQDDVAKFKMAEFKENFQRTAELNRQADQDYLNIINSKRLDREGMEAELRFRTNLNKDQLGRHRLEQEGMLGLIELSNKRREVENKADQWILEFDRKSAVDEERARQHRALESRIGASAGVTQEKAKMQRIAAGIEKDPNITAEQATAYLQAGRSEPAEKGTEQPAKSEASVKADLEAVQKHSVFDDLSVEQKVEMLKEIARDGGYEIQNDLSEWSGKTILSGFFLRKLTRQESRGAPRSERTPRSKRRRQLAPGVYVEEE